MFSLLPLLIIALTISSLLLLITLIIGKKMLKEREKLTPFECGFDPKSWARSPFSLKFFLITVIFLVFDIEIALLLPLGLLYFSGATSSFLSTATIITLILILGLMHEWKQGALKWIS